MGISPVAEDYLALIWKAGEWPDDAKRPTTSDLAAALGVTASTVSANLKRLAAQDLIAYEPYGVIELTRQGEQIAVEVVRRHRIIETFLAEQLGIPWDEVHAEADRLEHAVSQRLIDRMDSMLGFPEADPHGDPIPRMGKRDQIVAQVLTAFGQGETVQVVRVSDASAEILRFLSQRGIGIGAVVHIEEAMSATGLMRVRCQGECVEFSAPIATAIHATRQC